MGNLFYRGARPLEIESMSFSRLAYWNGWHEAMTRAERNPPKPN